MWWPVTENPLSCSLPAGLFLYALQSSDLGRSELSKSLRSQHFKGLKFSFLIWL